MGNHTQTVRYSRCPVYSRRDSESIFRDSCLSLWIRNNSIWPCNSCIKRQSTLFQGAWKSGHFYVLPTIWLKRIKKYCNLNNSLDYLNLSFVLVTKDLPVIIVCVCDFYVVLSYFWSLFASSGLLLAVDCSSMENTRTLLRKNSLIKRKWTVISSLPLLSLGFPISQVFAEL